MVAAGFFQADIIMALAGSNGGSWSTALAPKLNVTGISSDQQSAKAYHGTIATGRGVGDTLVSTQTGDSNLKKFRLTAKYIGIVGLGFFFFFFLQLSGFQDSE